MTQQPFHPVGAVQSHLFRIGGFLVCVTFSGASANSIRLLPSFIPFATESEGGKHDNVLLELTVDDSLRPPAQRELVRKFDTGNGDTVVYTLADGGYLFIIRDIHGRDCCLLQASSKFDRCRCALNGNWTMRSFGLNDALMLAFAYASSFHHTLLIHASCVCHEGMAYPFIAKSGTGKSTHTSLWMAHIPNTELLNDDNPIIRICSEGYPEVYGSPWSGKTPCYRNVKARLGAITRIERAPSNSIEQLKPVQAFASLLPACSSMKWDHTIYNNLCDTVAQVIEKTKVFTLHCLPDAEAALLCQKTIVCP